VRSFYRCPFLCKSRPSRVSLESPGLKNIPQVSGNPTKVAQNNHVRKAVSATLLVLKWGGAIFWSRSWKPSVRSFYLCPFLSKPRPSGVSLVSPKMENIPQVPGKPAKAVQSHDARKPVSATLSVLTWTGAIFWPRSSTASVRSFYLCPFYWKVRQSGGSLESPGLENIPQTPRNRAKVGENHDARKTVSATLALLK